MALKPGTSPDVVSANIKELMGSGRSQKEAIAAAMSMKRKSKKKMSDGGIVSDDGDEGLSSDFDESASRSIIENNALGAVKESSIASPESQDAEKMLAKKIYEASEAQELYSGGMVGDKPEPMNASTEDPVSDEPMKPSDIEHPVENSVPMSAALSEEATAAIMERKMKRRKMMGIPV